MKTNLNSDGQLFHQYQQNKQSPFTSTHWTHKQETKTYDVEHTKKETKTYDVENQVVCPRLSYPIECSQSSIYVSNNVFYIFQQEHENIEYKWTIFTEIKTCMTKGNVTRILKHPTGNNYVSPFDCFSLIFSSVSSASSQRSLSGP